MNQGQKMKTVQSQSEIEDRIKKNRSATLQVWGWCRVRFIHSSEMYGES